MENSVKQVPNAVWNNAPVHPRKALAMEQMPIAPRSLGSPYRKKRGRVLPPLNLGKR